MIVRGIALVLSSFFFISSSFALILLDETMPRDVQRKTGVKNLNHNQRAALEDWLNATFVLKTQPVEAPQQVTLSINIQGGKKLQLSDGSIYEIAPNDVNTASGWITPIPIGISDSGFAEYPILLTNQNTKNSIRARLVTNSSMSPSPTDTTTPPTTTTPPATNSPPATP